MINSGITNPALCNLLCRIRHTNTLVISDVGFPFFPEIETIDISLVRGTPTVQHVLDVIAENFTIGQAWMAEEFLKMNGEGADAPVRSVLNGAPLVFEPHVDFKKRVPRAIGLIRTGGTMGYSNIIIESA